MSLRDRLTSDTAVKAYIFLSGMLIVLFVLDTWVLPWAVHTRGETAIPFVIGAPEERARTMLIAAGVEPQIAAYKPDDRIAPGHVIFLDPPPRTVVRTGRNVYMTISGGEELIVMPNLRGRSLRDAKITLDREEMRLGLVTWDASDLPAETVISQSIVAGKRVKKGSLVEIAVSGGAAQVVDMPYLIGFSLAEAQQRLASHGLRTGTVSYRKSASLQSNTVIGQNPAAGDQVPPSSPVELVVVQ
jgi:eukaryotic-like serine/threonine-protein kinase